jgi:hydrogenase maturation protease
VTGKTLIAGIGNVFLGDDGFGVEVAARLAQESLGPGVRVVDTGIRARDLAYELLDGGYDTAILVDAVARGDAPGTVSLIDPAALPDASDASKRVIDAHAMNPETVLSFLNGLGGVSTRIWIVGCEPACVEEGVGLSAPVAAAIVPALTLVRELATGFDPRPIDHATAVLRSTDTCV